MAHSAKISLQLLKQQLALMRLLALFLGNLQGPACVIQPAIARQIIKTCHRNLPFFTKKAGNYVFIANEGKEEDRKQREVEPGQEPGAPLGQLARGLPNLRALSAQDPLLADSLLGPRVQAWVGGSPFQPQLDSECSRGQEGGGGWRFLSCARPPGSPCAVVL